MLQAIISPMECENDMQFHSEPISGDLNPHLMFKLPQRAPERKQLFIYVVYTLRQDLNSTEQRCERRK